MTQDIALPGRAPGWGAAFLLVALSGRVIDILTIRFDRIGGDGGLPPLHAFRDGLISWQTPGHGLALLGGLTGLAIVCYLLCVILGAEVPQFPSLFALLIQSEGIVVTSNLVNLLLISLQNRGGLPETSDMLALPGLDLLVRGSPVGLGMRYFLKSLNPFAVWYAATLASNLRHSTGLTTGKVLLVALLLIILRNGIPALLLDLAYSSGGF